MLPFIVSDFVSIYDGTRKVDNQTGEIFPTTYHSSTYNVTIQFTSKGEMRGLKNLLHVEQL